MTRPTRRDVLAGVAASLITTPARSAGDGGMRTLEARPGKVQIVGSGETDILGFDGTAPGPLLRYRQGDELSVRFVNRLEQPATIHWHGLRGENAMEGVAPLTQKPVAPGESFDYRRRLAEPGLFAYRPSVYGQTPELMGRGLKGLLIVDETTPLPADHDLLLVLDDCRLDAKAQFAGSFTNDQEARGGGRIGDALLVNGKPAPASQAYAPGSRVRLRLANLANARIMIVSFSGVQPFVIAIDGQPCEAFEPVRKSIPVAPGARFELMFDMPRTEGERARIFLREPGGGESDLLVATAKGTKVEGRGLIYSLPQNRALPPEIKLGDSKKVDLVIASGDKGWTINGAPTKGYAGEPLFHVKRGAPVTLGFVNTSVWPLAMHAHGQALRLLHDLDDGWEPYWRNGVIVPAGKTKHVAFIPDSPGKWAIHDDILDHEAAGLATWFSVD